MSQTRRLLVELRVHPETGGFAARLLDPPVDLVTVNSELDEAGKLMLTPGTALHQLGEVLDEALATAGWVAIVTPTRAAPEEPPS